MEIIKSKKYYAVLTIGLRKGYSDECIPVDAFFGALSHLQNKLIKEKNIYLSANCTESMIILSGQREPHLNIKFISYPRFPLKEKEFKNSVNALAIDLMKTFNQNRIVIEFNDGFMMMQENESIDSSITH